MSSKSDVRFLAGEVSVLRLTSEQYIFIYTKLKPKPMGRGT
jgi:hypothetical protein